MLAVVEHQQQSLPTHMMNDCLQQALPWLLADRERHRDRLRDTGRFSQRTQIHEPHAIRMALEQTLREPHGKSRLSTSTDPRHGQQPRLAEEPSAFGQLCFASDEARALLRQIVRDTSGSGSLLRENG